MSGVSDTLDAIAFELSSASLAKKAGIMAADFIRSHIAESRNMEPLSSATQAYRGAGKPLNDTGHLRDSITAEQISRYASSVGTTDKTAAVHNNGARITAKKNWLYIPCAGTRRLQRKYGYSPKEVLSGLRTDGNNVFRAYHTVYYRKKGSKQSKAHAVYFLKKSVVIPKREFWYLTDDETEQIVQEIFKEQR